MNKLLLGVLLLLACHTVLAQDAAKARIEYEEAEVAYTENNYELALNKLTEVEKLLKATNPRTLYLRINAQWGIIQKNPYQDFTLLQEAKKACLKYMKDYAKLANGEDKFKAVYKIDQKLQAYPSNLSDFQLAKANMQKANEKLKEDEINKAKEIEAKFKNYVYFEGYKLGLTLEETLSKYPQYKKNYKYKDQTGGGFRIGAKDLYMGSLSQPVGFIIKNNKVYGYWANLLTLKPDDENYSKGKKLVTDICNELKTNFFAPTEKEFESTTKVSGADFYTKTTVYTWAKFNKTITVTLSQARYLGENTSSLSMESSDPDLAN